MYWNIICHDLIIILSNFLALLSLLWSMGKQQTLGYDIKYKISNLAFGKQSKLYPKGLKQLKVVCR